MGLRHDDRPAIHRDRLEAGRSSGCWKLSWPPRSRPAAAAFTTFPPAIHCTHWRSPGPWAARPGLEDQQLPIPPTLADAIARGLERWTLAAYHLLAGGEFEPDADAGPAACRALRQRLHSAVREDVIEVSGDRVIDASAGGLDALFAGACAMLASCTGCWWALVRDRRGGARAASRARARRRTVDWWLRIEQAAGNASRRGAPGGRGALAAGGAPGRTLGDAVEAERSRTVAAAEQHKAAGDLGRARLPSCTRPPRAARRACPGACTRGSSPSDPNGTTSSSWLLCPTRPCSTSAIRTRIAAQIERSSPRRGKSRGSDRDRPQPVGNRARRARRTTLDCLCGRLGTA